MIMVILIIIHLKQVNLLIYSLISLIIIKINQVQSYSEKAERMVNKYVIIRSEKIGNKNKNTTVLESYQLAEVVQLLAELYKNA